MNSKSNQLEIIWSGMKWILDSRRVLLHPEKKILILSDIHIGLYTTLREQGSYLPTYDQKILIETLEGLFKTYSDWHWVISGDIKHTHSDLASISNSEVNELVEVLRLIISNVNELTLLIGNHDKGIEDILIKYDLNCSLSIDYELNTVLITHQADLNNLNHTTKDKFLGVIIGHIHPLMVIPRIHGINVPVFAVSENVIMMPAFNQVVGGILLSKLSLNGNYRYYGILRNKIIDLINLIE